MPSDSVVTCDGVQSQDLVDVLPGPTLVARGETGLRLFDAAHLDGTTPPSGISREQIARTHGTKLAGGHLHFDGAMLRDARRPGRAWPIFSGVLPGAMLVLVAPNADWALVVAREGEVHAIHLVRLIRTQQK